MKFIANCSDLYDNAAEKLKKIDNDIDKTIQDLARRVEERGVQKNKVARQVVKELTARDVLTKSRIYEGLGIEYKRKYKKKVIEEIFPHVENIVTEESSTPRAVILEASSSSGQLETLEYLNGRPDTKSEPEEQIKTKAPRQKHERLKDKDTIEYLLKQVAQLRGQNTGSELRIEKLEKQLAEKEEQISRFRKDKTANLENENLPEHFRELQLTVNPEGYEEAFEDVNRPNVESAVVMNLQKSWKMCQKNEIHLVMKIK